MNELSLTALRDELYSVADEVISTGIPRRIKRKGHYLNLVCEKTVSKLSRLKKHHAIVGDPDKLVDFSPGKWAEPQHL